VAKKAETSPRIFHLIGLLIILTSLPSNVLKINKK
jgi:hypothetical protein